MATHYLCACPRIWKIRFCTLFPASLLWYLYLWIIVKYSSTISLLTFSFSHFQLLLFICIHELSFYRVGVSFVDIFHYILWPNSLLHGSFNHCSSVTFIQVLKKADMIRKNAVKSVLAERDILISVCNPFVVSRSIVQNTFFLPT